MCGFIALYSLQDSVRHERHMRVAQDSLRKRGPDDSGIWSDSKVILAHQRLSILDLSSDGHQPMMSESGDLVITYNGEIYNYRELRNIMGGSYRSGSDTEVILRAYEKWGPSCVEHFRGMFAFVIWDRKKQELFGARDRLGVKPFYYAQVDQGMMFASRPKAIWPYIFSKSGMRFQPQSVRYFLEGGFVPGELTVFEGIHKLLPGHRFTYSAESGFRHEKYWDFNSFASTPSPEKVDEFEVAQEFQRRFTEAVEMRLVSDVPLGAFLSGGVDSSLVVAAMAKLSDTPIKTFSIGFHEKDYDETPYAEMVAKHLRTDHQSEILGVDGLIDLIPEMIRSFDEPFFDSSAFPSIAVARLARKKVSVVLTGDGGDEFFGGYHYYKIISKMNNLYALPSFVNTIARITVGLIPSHRFQLLTQALEMRNTSELYAFLRSIQKDYPTTVNSDTKQQTSSIMDYYLGQFEELRSTGTNLDPVSEAMRMDALNILPDEYLTKVDLATMGQSIEARNPFLDHKLVEWAVQLPINVKINAGISKKILRDAGRDLLPPAILQGKKKGFVVPIDRWLRTSLKDWAYSIISDKSLYDRVPIDRNVVLNLFDIHLSGKRNTHPILWAAIMFLVFAKEHENFQRLDL